MKNTIILTSGKSNRFPPFIYEKPKGLFKVRGEVLTHRQIEQLREVDIKEIDIVGFIEEKFFILKRSMVSN